MSGKDTTPPISRKKTVSAVEWAKAESMWKLGTAKQKELASMLGVSMTAVAQHMKRKNIIRGSESDKLREKLERETERKELSKVEIKAQRIEDTRDQHYKYADNIAKLTWREIQTAMEEKRQFSSIEGNLKSLDRAITIFGKARMERFISLGIDGVELETDEIPSLEISELTAEQIEELRDKQELEYSLEINDEEESEENVHRDNNGNIINDDDE